MKVAKKIARLIYPEFRFGKTSIKDGLKLVELGVGGFCLYGGRLQEVIETIRILRKASKTPLIFAADYENGVGQWIKEATLLPSNMAIGATNHPEFAKRKAEITAIEANAIGVDWVFAPVVDLATNHSNPIVNLRAFSDSPEKVCKFALHYIWGLNSFNVLNCIKHFPGHGDTSVDSHLSLPAIAKTKKELFDLELKPFEYLANKADSVMVAHLKINSLDRLNITSFSRNVISGLLVKELKFKGLVITDALSMKAISDESYAGVNAFLAGAHILLVPENPYKLYSAMIEALRNGKIKEPEIENAIEKQNILLRKRNALKNNIQDISIVGSFKHRKFVKDIASCCITWVKKRENSLLKKFKNAFYLEPLKTGNLKGEKFVKTLKSQGYRLTQDIKNCELLIIGAFIEPKAYSGKIDFEHQEKLEIERILKYNKKTLLISFGSPFIFDSYYNKIDYGICSFGALEEFQEALALGLLGKIKFSGTMPVKLKTE